MNDPLLSSLIGTCMLLAAFVGVLQWLRYAANLRSARLRIQGHRLIHALGAYSAWIDAQHDQPFTARSLDELTSPEPLTRARLIKQEHFPELSAQMFRLLQTHSRVIEYLWELNLLRLTQSSGWRPAYEDPPYQQIRAAQEELIDEIVLQCRELIGETRQQWRATGSDFSFSNTLTRTGPATGA
ncbi:hypothetical protein [Caenimonas aquaedulcis]|uniref:Uncharacterized protein n=1 Tax=Caenimonas aquaedulcis TaxID=2793270 RepID=A0A931H8F9_9BURK|nr:hypothetical protein [Caenimonas aquaedulcis]MBG9390255.1 hypothetical protein [Caenimonas aquaedulcis]